MRFRTICMILTPFLLLVACFWARDWQFDGLRVASDATNRDDSKREMTIRLDKEDWVEFQLPAQSTSLRILTNAGVASHELPTVTQADPRPGWRYAVEYELVSASGKIIRKSKYHFRSRVRQTVDSDTGEILVPMIFGGNGLFATQTRMMQIPAGDQLNLASRVRLRIESADEQIEQVVARVATRVERQDYDDPQLWNQVTRETRRSIAKYCVFGHDLLNDNERANLMRWHWVQAPPVGEPEKQFLFFIGAIDDQEVCDTLLPSGMYLEPGWIGTLPIPQGRGDVRLEFKKVTSSEYGEPIDIQVRWEGRQLHERESFSHQVINEEPYLFNANGGLAEIEASAPIVVRAFWDKPIFDEMLNKSVDRKFLPNEVGLYEITPSPLVSRWYQADTKPVEFNVSHVEGCATPFRVSLRGTYEQGATVESQASLMGGEDNRNVRWEFLDEHMKVIREGNFQFEPLVSPYDRYRQFGQPQILSDSEQRFFNIPLGVRKIRFYCLNAPVLIAGAVRPANLVSETRVPEDYLPFYRGESPYRQWFTIQPEAYLDLVRENRSYVVRSQTRPSEIDPEILAGNYEWFRFDPSGSWLGRQMLVPKHDDAPLRQQVIDSAFYEVETDQTYRFESHANQGMLLHRRLIYRSIDSPGVVTIQCDGKVVFEQKLSSARGEIDLEDLLPGLSGQIKISSQSPMLAFLGGCKIHEAQPYVKRTAAKFGKGELTFEYEKLTHEDELLTLMLYREERGKDRFRVRVEIDAARQSEVLAPADSWTVRKREYSLSPGQAHDAFLLGTDATIDSGYRCFIKLGKDLPPGKYAIRAEQVDNASQAYMLLYQARPGTLPRRRIETGRVQLGAK